LKVAVTAYRRVPRVVKRLALRKVGLVRRLRAVSLPKVVLVGTLVRLLTVVKVRLRAVRLRVVRVRAMSLRVVRLRVVHLRAVRLRVERVMARTQSLRQRPLRQMRLRWMRLLPDAAWL
jgi:hypothetical protein